MVLVQILTPVSFDDAVTDTERYELQHDYDIIWRGRFLRCPAGMTTDGASIPRIAWRLFGHPFQRPLIRGAIPHDGGYNGRLVDNDNKPVYLTKAECDQMLYDVGVFAGVHWFKIRGVYQAVHLFGGSSYHGQAPKAMAA